MIIEVNVIRATRFVNKSGEVVLSALASFGLGKIKTPKILNGIKHCERDDGRWRTKDGIKH
jgi:hypothetical protein